jgi:hypothetical protein
MIEGIRQLENKFKTGLFFTLDDSDKEAWRRVLSFWRQSEVKLDDFKQTMNKDGEFGPLEHDVNCSINC